MTINQYKIYQNPQGEYEAVKEGWSWPAFFFSWIWAMVKKLWKPGGIALAVLFVLSVISSAIGDYMGILVNIGALVIGLIFGTIGYQWREKNLPERGYEYKTTVTASTPEGAIALYVEETKQAGESAQ